MKMLKTNVFVILIVLSLSSTFFFSFATNNSDPYEFKKKIKEDQITVFNSNVDDLVIQYMLEGHIPSLEASLVYKDKIIWTKGYGEQPKVDTVYKIGSITKCFTATALLQLYEQGKFELDDDVNKYLPFSIRNPYYPNKPVTFRLLLLHQSSLLRGGDLYYSYILNDLEQQLGVSNESLLVYPDWLEDIFLSDPSNDSEVWATWAPAEKQYYLTYSNLGYDLLGYLIEILSNQSIDEYFKKNIFDPLNMTNTHYTYQSYSPDRLAIPHEWIPEGHSFFYPLRPEDYPNGSDRNHHIPIFNLDERGAGALRSTTTDLANFLIAHMNNGIYGDNRILSENLINLMHNESQVFYGNKIYDSYGFGWMNEKIITVEVDGKDVTHFLQGHGGRVFGFNSLMLFNQDINIGVIVFVNQGNNFYEDDPISPIFKVLYEEGINFREAYISSSDDTSGFEFLIVILTVIFYGSFNKIFRKK
ncbi:serine hydrolase domain-containing protein [Candidatus Hodarchaeum mangrovi]